jgi:hypothetical protein
VNSSNVYKIPAQHYEEKCCVHFEDISSYSNGQLTRILLILKKDYHVNIDNDKNGVNYDIAPGLTFLEHDRMSWRYYLH